MAADAIKTLDKSIGRCQYLCRRAKLFVFKVLLYESENWMVSHVFVPFATNPCTKSSNSIGRTVVTLRLT